MCVCAYVAYDACAYAVLHMHFAYKCPDKAYIQFIYNIIYPCIIFHLNV